MKELFMLALGIEMVNKMKEARTMERVEAAATIEEKTEIVRETESMVFDVIDSLFKPEEEIGKDGIEAKEEIAKATIEHQYVYFKLPNPFEYGTTFEEIKLRNGRMDSTDEEFFM